MSDSDGELRTSARLVRGFVVGSAAAALALVSCTDRTAVVEPDDASPESRSWLLDAGMPGRFAQLTDTTLAKLCPTEAGCQIVDDPASDGQLCSCSLAGLNPTVNPSDPPSDPPPLWPDPPGWAPEPTPPPGGWPPGGECDEGCPVPVDPYLDCSTNVERGGEATCTVRVESDHGVWIERVYRWVLQPDMGGNPIVHEPNPSSGVVLTWQGTVVTSGDVRVVIKVGGSDMVVASRIHVRPRSWSWSSSNFTFQSGAAPVHPEGEGSPWYQVVQGGLFRAGWACSMPTQADCASKRFVRPDYGGGESGGFQTSSVTIGPNAGLYYVSSTSFYSHRGSAVNSRVTSFSSESYTSTLPAQASCSPNHWFNANNCLGGASSQDLVTGVLDHEGYGTSGSNGHQSFYESEALKAQFDPKAVAERLVGRSQSELNNQVQDSIKDLSDNLEIAVDALGEPSGNYPSATRWAWDPNLQYWRSLTWSGG